MIVFGGTGRVGLSLRDQMDGIFLGRSDCDLRCSSEVKACLDHYRPSQVIHLAATCGSSNQDKSYEYYYDNVLMGINLFHECIQRNIRLIAVSSVAAYSGVGVPVEGEVHNAAPNEYNFSYAFSKRALDAQRRASGYSDCVILYPSNLYGPYDYFGEGCHVIPSLWSRMGTSDHITVSNSDSVRQFLYLEDFARIIRLIIADCGINGELNVAPGEHYSIKEVVTKLGLIAGYKGELQFECGGEFKVVSNGKFLKLFPDFQFTNIDDGLRKFHIWCGECK